MTAASSVSDPPDSKLPDHGGLSGPRRELVRVVRRIQTLTREINELRRRERDTGELDAKERELDELRWRFAAVARRTAAGDPRYCPDRSAQGS